MYGVKIGGQEYQLNPDTLEWSGPPGKTLTELQLRFSPLTAGVPVQPEREMIGRAARLMGGQAFAPPAPIPPPDLVL